MLLAWVGPALALSPYVRGDKLICNSLPVCVDGARKKLQAAGFRVVGVHAPPGVPQAAVVVVIDAAFLEAVRRLGGQAIIGAGIRIGVHADGRLSYINPDYWYRAYFRRKFDVAAKDVTALAIRLAKTLGRRGEFGGDVPATELPTYRYLLGMEQFDSDKTELTTYRSFEAALQAVQANLARRVAHTSKVYEIIMPDKKLAVFGVAMNDPKRGEGWWVKKAGPEHIAALPWELYIVNGKVYALYARYRTALAWPALSMGSFMAISDHPDTAHEMLTRVAGGQYERPGW